MCTSSICTEISTALFKQPKFPNLGEQWRKIWLVHTLGYYAEVEKYDIEYICMYIYIHVKWKKHVTEYIFSLNPLRYKTTIFVHIYAYVYINT